LRQNIQKLPLDIIVIKIKNQ